LLARAVAVAGGIPVRTSVAPLDVLRGRDLGGATLVTASALLDVLTADELRAVVDATLTAGAPVLLALSVTGRVALAPAEPLDGLLQAAFNDHQRRVVAGRRLLGPEAVLLAEGLLTESGWRVRTAETPWRLDPVHAALADGWLRGWLAAALEQRPALAAAAVGYRRRREAQLADGAHRVTVHHRDLLAWPA
ncbi:MAG: SAM-dependent methyltransferase, partial [Amnibacterium sp.]